MPKKAESGESTADLLAYLFDPGNHDEHTDPHLVAAWTPDLPCPARTPGRMTLADLALLLDAPVDALRGPARPSTCGTSPSVTSPTTGSCRTPSGRPSLLRWWPPPASPPPG
ncbi:hypothetical protein ABXI76_36285 [Streptomyces parvus]